MRPYKQAGDVLVPPHAQSLSNISAWLTEQCTCLPLGCGEFDLGFFLQAKDLPTFKDNDFLNEGQKLHVGEESKKNFLEKLKRDVEVEFPGDSFYFQCASHTWILWPLAQAVQQGLSSRSLLHQLDKCSQDCAGGRGRPSAWVDSVE